MRHPLGLGKHSPGVFYKPLERQMPRRDYTVHIVRKKTATYSIEVPRILRNSTDIRPPMWLVRHPLALVKHRPWVFRRVPEGQIPMWTCACHLLRSAYARWPSTVSPPLRGGEVAPPFGRGKGEVSIFQSSKRKTTRLESGIDLEFASVETDYLRIGYVVCKGY